MRDEKVKVLKSIPPIDPANVVRGQFSGYRSEPGVAPDSTVETFAALRLEIDSWRWQGVPFYIRAGKCLPVTSTEVVVRLCRPPRIFPVSTPGDYVRFRISPDVAIAMGATVMDDADAMTGQPIELLASRRPAAGEMDAYERVLDGRDRWRLDALRPRGLRRGSVAHRRSGVATVRARPSLRPGDVGTGIDRSGRRAAGGLAESRGRRLNECVNG